MQTADTRSLFTGLVSRKADTWGRVNGIPYEELTDRQIRALRALRVIALPAGVDPIDDHPVFGRENPIEQLVVVGAETYYVNTEGYTYARYALRISGWRTADARRDSDALVALEAMEARIAGDRVPPTTTYDMDGLTSREAYLRATIAKEHVGNCSKGRGAMDWKRFSLMVHAHGASMIVAGQCSECLAHLNRSEAL